MDRSRRQGDASVLGAACHTIARLACLSLCLASLTGCPDLHKSWSAPPRCTPVDELCDAVDNDCDGAIDEDFDLTADPAHCGSCDRQCSAVDDTLRCVDGECLRRVEPCEPGWRDADGEPGNGCEARCDAAETCNGLDDDCDGHSDEEVTPPPSAQGVCAGMMPICAGQRGWVLPVAGAAGYEADEVSCDGHDNDCDGRVDEAQRVGEPCMVGEGECRRAGVFVCSARTGDGICDAIPGPASASDSTCDGKDDDCDGEADQDPPCNAGGCGVVPPGFACVPAGVFQMGDGEHAAPQEITLTRPFLLAVTEVTQEEWHAATGHNPAYHARWGDTPVERVSWFDALAYANLRSDAEGLSRCYVIDGCNGALLGGCGDDSDFPHRCGGAVCASVERLPGCTGYRLPTEAEWEYAARAGTQARFACGDDPACLEDIAWTAANSDFETRSVATRAPNAWGLYDMHGNVMELVFDDFEGEASPQIDPIRVRPPGAQDRRVVRDCAADFDPSQCEVTRRLSAPPALRNASIGLRLARSLSTTR